MTQRALEAGGQTLRSGIDHLNFGWGPLPSRHDYQLAHRLWSLPNAEFAQPDEEDASEDAQDPDPPRLTST